MTDMLLALEEACETLNRFAAWRCDEYGTNDDGSPNHDQDCRACEAAQVKQRIDAVIRKAKGEA